MVEEKSKDTTSHKTEEHKLHSVESKKEESKSSLYTDEPVQQQTEAPTQQAYPANLVCQICLNPMYPMSNSTIYTCYDCGAQRYYNANQMTMGQP